MVRSSRLLHQPMLDFDEKWKIFILEILDFLVPGNLFRVASFGRLGLKCCARFIVKILW